MTGSNRIWLWIAAVFGMLMLIPAAGVMVKLAVTSHKASVSHAEPTQEAFRVIRLGMTTAELRQLLGQPEFSFAESGLMKGGAYFTFEPGTRRGLQKYVRQQWDSADRAYSITAVSDVDGRVVWKSENVTAKVSR
jgi:hypothetical protein